MSWLNFNDSLNNIKGQLSNLANTVLADDKIEIQSTAGEVTESEDRREGKTNNNAFHTDDKWQWSTDESKTDQLKTDETITNLKKRIVELENENRDLITSLDQLDQDHQLNTDELVKLKSKLEEELENVTEKYEILNMKYNKLALAENAYKKKVNELKSKYEELSQKKESGAVKNDNEDLSSKYKQLEHEKAQLEEKVSSLVETNKGLEKLLQDSNSEIESKLSELASKNQQLETENKALRIALQSTKNEITLDNDRMKEYESKIENLENELKRTEGVHSNTVNMSGETMESQLENTNVIRSYEKRIQDLENELEEKRKMEAKMHLKCMELEEFANKFEESKEAKKIYEDQIEDLKSQLLKLTEVHLTNLEQVKHSSETIKSQLKTDMENLSYEKRIQDLEDELEKKSKVETEMHKRCVELEEFKNKFEESNEANETTKKIYEEQIEDLKGQLLKLTEEHLKNQQQAAEAEKILQEYKSQYEELVDKSKRIHSEYSRIIDDHLMEYFDYNTSGTNIDGDDSSLITIFSKRMETISKIIIDFEMKCSSLETKLFELSQSKTDLQNEKNAEIERLIQNSEMLTQELLKRSQEIKDLEEECSQLMKNNDLLINKLTESKDTGLQTIYESNEDNEAIFEKQLETANKKIEELERSLSDHDSKNEPNSSANSETIEEEPNAVGQLKMSFEELKNNLDRQEEDNERLRKLVEELQHKLETAENERDNCRTVIDKMRHDFETTEYQFSEMNINLETLSEEIEKHKLRIDCLVSENESLKSLKNDNERIDEQLKLDKEELSRSIHCIDNLKLKLEELETKHASEMQNKNREIEKLQKELEMRSGEATALQEQIENIAISSSQIQGDLVKLESINKSFTSFYSKLCGIVNVEVHEEIEDVPKTGEIIQHVSNLVERVKNLEMENVRLNSQIVEYQTKLTSFEHKGDVQKELQDLMASRNELIAIVQTKHQETLTYHAEIQRLSEILKTETDKNVSLENEIQTLRKNLCSVDTLNAKNEEIEKMADQISFLREKCDILTQNLLDEQRKVENEKLTSAEKESTTSKKLERLQNHLMEVEEHYTQELLQAEQKIAFLQARLNEIEQREKDSSTLYTSVSIRANQQNESLQQQLQSMTSQRNEIRRQLMELEDENNVKSAALSNLQLVLEQFQRDKEADVVRETDRIRRQVKLEQEKQNDLRNEIANLQSQLKESKQGLQAALRLTDQLEMSKSQISNLKETVTVLTEKLTKKEEELKMVVSQTDGKVDKSLVKNLVIGFVTSNKNLNKDQMQILKIIATVLDFNEQDHNRVNLNQTQHRNWLASLLNPAAGDDIPPSESLSRAFVNFLEQESKPRVIPSLLASNSPSETSPSSRSSSNSRTPTPIVLNEIVLPTFSDFPQHRNSSSILKGVLKDNT